MEMRTMQHLDAHSRALSEINQMDTAQTVELLTCEPQMANLLSVKALPMTLVCGACEPTNMFSHRSSSHVDVRLHVRRQEISAKCAHECSQTMFHELCGAVEDPTTSPHRAITSDMKNEKKNVSTRAPSERQKVRELSTVAVTMSAGRHPPIFANARWINKKRWQLFSQCCDHGSQPKHTSSHNIFQPQFVDGCQ